MTAREERDVRSEECFAPTADSAMHLLQRFLLSPLSPLLSV
jgi:hypothetical protein